MNRTDRLLECFRDTPDDLVFWSFRYFLGRMSIHACCFAEDLASAWPRLNSRVASIIHRELEEAFARDDVARATSEKRALPLGMDCDRAAWECVRTAYGASTPPKKSSRRRKKGVDASAGEA